MAKEFDELHREITEFLRASRDELQDPKRLNRSEETIKLTPPKSFIQNFKESVTDPDVLNYLIKPVSALIIAVGFPTAVGVYTGEAGLTAAIAYGETAAIIAGLGIYTIKQTLEIRRMRQARFQG